VPTHSASVCIYQIMKYSRLRVVVVLDAVNGRDSEMQEVAGIYRSAAEGYFTVH